MRRLRGVSGTGEVKFEGACAGGGVEVKRRGWMRYTYKQSKNLLHQTKEKCYRLGNCIVLVWMV